MDRYAIRKSDLIGRRNNKNTSIGRDRTLTISILIVWLVFYASELVVIEQLNCGIRHVTVPIATRILIANVRHIVLSNICVINLVYFKMQV